MDLLCSALESYRLDCETRQTPDHLAQIDQVEQFLKLAKDGPAALHRTHAHSHFTGSVLITNPDFDSVLLTLHRKLGLWLQLGGHADGDPDLAAVAMREGQEESGIEDLRLYSATPGTFFDLDIHWIPERPGEAGHNHYDVRYVAIAHRDAPLVITPESKELRWFPLSDAYGLSSQWSMHRQFDKLSWFKKHGGST